MDAKKESKASMLEVGDQLSNILVRMGVIESWNWDIPSSDHFSLMVGRSTVGAMWLSGVEEIGVERENFVRITSCLLA